MHWTSYLWNNIKYINIHVIGDLEGKKEGNRREKGEGQGERGRGQGDRGYQ